MDRRTTAALERLGELPPPRTPLSEVVTHLDPPPEGAEWAEQPSPVTDVRDWLESFAERLRNTEQLLRDSRDAQARRAAGGDDALQGLVEEARSARSEASTLREKANEEVPCDDEGPRIGPIPREISAGQREPVWVAIPFEGDDSVTGGERKEGARGGREG